MLLVCLYTPTFAQIDTTTNKVQYPTPTIEQRPVDFRVPDESKIEEYKGDPRFQYKKVEKGISWWDRLLMRILEFFDGSYSSIVESRVLSIFVLLAIVVLVCLVIFKLLGINYQTLLGKKELDTPEIDIYTENVHDMNFDKLISSALSNGDYRLAVRFLYLKNLKLLSDKEVIEWKPNKTNYSYQYEINNNSIRIRFLEITSIFDYVWYGEFVLDESKYSIIHSRMSDFNNLVSHER